MKTLHLHIGSYKAGSTAIQHALYNNRNELNDQGFMYPGNLVDQKKLFFLTKSPREYWPISFMEVDKQALEQDLKQSLAVLEADINSDYKNVIMSTEHFYIDREGHIENTVRYFQQFFPKIIVYVFVRDPLGLYKSFQQELIKYRSFVDSPVTFRHIFKRVIEAWSNFCEVRVLEYGKQKNSFQTICEEIGIDYKVLAEAERRINTSISIEQMALLEKTQKHLYQHKNRIIKPHLQAIKKIQAPFTHKPVLKEPVQQIVYHNHKDDLKWLKEGFGIDFFSPELDVKTPLALPAFAGRRMVSVRDVFEVDEWSVSHYEALVMDALLQKLVKNENQVQ